MTQPPIASAFLILAVLAGCAGGFGDQADLLVADGPEGRGGVRLTYLGTNGYLIESAGSRLLVDPYFTRVGLGTVALNQPIQPNAEAIERHASGLPRRIDAILVTHGHFDHLLDVPSIARRSGAKVFASPTAIYLGIAAGAPYEQLHAVLPGDVVRVGAATIRVLPADHDTLCCDALPFPGTLAATPAPPTRPSDWLLGTSLAFLIEVGGRVIYVDSGGRLSEGEPAPAFGGLPPRPIDLAIIGVALGDGRARLVPLLERLRPAYVLPSHQDDFFRPLQDGFFYGPTADPAAVRRAHAESGIGELVLLDYFTPWILP